MDRWLFIFGIVLLTCLRNCSTRRIELKYCPERCMNIWSCPFYWPFMSARPYPDFFTMALKNNVCGFVNAENTIPKMCCPEFESRTDIVYHKNFRLLPIDICGPIPIAGRIVGGEFANLIEFPWMVLLAYKTDDPARNKLKCGGTLINDRYVLTAAHCVHKQSKNLAFVRLGEYNIKTFSDCDDYRRCEPPAQDVRPGRIVIHPEYNPRNLVNDIALIRLTTKANLAQTNIKPICLPFGALSHVNLVHQNVTVTGWGLTESGWRSPILKKVSIQVQPKSACKDMYGRRIDFSETQICAGGATGKDSCGGDSGGPLQHMVLIGDVQKIVQEGMVSYGSKTCGIKNHPAIYTNVTFFMKWILDNLRP